MCLLVTYSYSFFKKFLTKAFASSLNYVVWYILFVFIVEIEFFIYCLNLVSISVINNMSKSNLRKKYLFGK